MIHFSVCVVERLHNSVFIHFKCLSCSTYFILCINILFLFQSIILRPHKCLEYFFYMKGFPAHSTITKLEGQWFHTGCDNEFLVLPVAVSETKSPFSSFYAHSFVWYRKLWVEYFHSPINNVLACLQRWTGSQIHTFPAQQLTVASTTFYELICYFKFMHSFRYLPSLVCNGKLRT